MTKLSSSASPTLRRRWRTTLGLGVTVGALTAASLVFSQPANAGVSPRDPNSRFISIINSCDIIQQRSMSYRVTGMSANGAVWKVWSGSINCNGWTNYNRALFAWTPPNPTDRLVISITTGGRSWNEYLAGNQNYCFFLTPNGGVRSEKNGVSQGTSSCNPRPS